MTKKVFALFLVLILAAPAIGFACNCCPSNFSSTSQISILGARHNCCPTIELNSGKCTTEFSRKSAPASSKVLISQVSLTEEVLSISNSPEPRLVSNDFGPPLFTSETPLYLVLQILRL